MPRANRDTKLLVFAKAPRPGAVKTRLVPVLGAQAAAALHARLIKRALATARASGVGQIELHCAPDCNDPFFRFCGGRYGVSLMAQRGGDLGKRMLYAFEHTLASVPRAILIGTDCPALTDRQLRDADGWLAAGMDAVVAPAEDGGYALLGLTRCDARLFEGIAWGTSHVMKDTRERLSAVGWRWQELDSLWDVDRPEDYQRLLASGLLDRPSVRA